MTPTTKQRAWRTAATLTGATTALMSLGVALPAQAHAALRCETLRATVTNSQGLAGGTVRATVCKADNGDAHFHEGYYNYVQDHQPDGTAARAYVRERYGTYGPIGVDDTSTSGGQSISWMSNGAGNTTIRVYVCLGTKNPNQSGARCASDYMS
ncbi:hypothetical protein [Streptomyces sp. TRM64462]|uniref:hypothetical protein n=1 Tax=Streptomyces sp. TRM64462 TaxID=2741726 RepID=UPI001586B81A|nr:hypothetical protein [Streptomyces sp. TRM64462]